MEAEGGEERVNEEGGCAVSAEIEGKVGDKGKEKEVEEGDVDDEEEEEEEEEYAFRFESGMNPLDFTEDDVSGLQPYQQFERLEYEALAEKKRRARESVGERSPKKARVDDNPGASFEEIMEVMNYSVRRKSRKLKKRGRKKGSKKRLSPEITQMLGNSTICYAYGQYEEAISVLNQVVKLAPNLPDPYHTLGLIYDALGNTKKAMDFYMIAAHLKSKDSSLWKLLFTLSLEQRNNGQARYCLFKAISADPCDISLRFHQASLYIDLGDFQRAVETYELILKICPNNVEAIKMGAKCYLRCSQLERAVGILMEYISNNPSEADLSVIDLLSTIYMENNMYEKSLQLILRYSDEKSSPLKLLVKAGICHIHIGNYNEAETLFNSLDWESADDHSKSITEVADSYMSIEKYDSALKYYRMVRGTAEESGTLHFKVAQCFLSLGMRESAVAALYKGLQGGGANVGARLTLATLLQEDGREDDAISILSPPEDAGSKSASPNETSSWWTDQKVKYKLCNIYRARGMLEEFVETISQLVRESLYTANLQHKVRPKKRIPRRVLFERSKILDDQENEDNVFRGFRPIAPTSDLLKAARAKRLLQKRASLKEERKAVAEASGVDCSGDESDDEQESPQQPTQLRDEPPLHKMLKEEEFHCLLIDLCKALGSLKRYWEALELVDMALRSANKILSAEKENELRSLGAQIAHNAADPKHGLKWVRQIVRQHPNSLAAWNCYYEVTSRADKHCRESAKFLRHLRLMHKDSVPPIIISGHQFTVTCHYQDAAREYLEAYKLMPDCPLINLCVGSSLINLALGFRLQNKHQCITQGLAFLYNNLQLDENNQESMYNFACALHRVGLVNLAAAYYEKGSCLQLAFDIPEERSAGSCEAGLERSLHVVTPPSLDGEREGRKRRKGRANKVEGGGGENTCLRVNRALPLLPFNVVPTLFLLTPVHLLVKNGVAERQVNQSSLHLAIVAPPVPASAVTILPFLLAPTPSVGYFEFGRILRIRIQPVNKISGAAEQVLVGVFRYGAAPFVIFSYCRTTKVWLRLWSE
ncbi:hypothetical protein MLD38_015784 [Melastoma candidum]|uniref:Uncharacterized protein n=1 Tax=Melastoma candidum TaxID=119954 RepID=A0ACB9RGJ0_9MYRT|nr:hypothetical protein MLD38_015784 [Melastoma candidum]